jgi:argininosuccinate synthase
LSDVFIPKYSELVYNGFWFSPGREALQALITKTQRDMSSAVRLKLYKGNIIVVGRNSSKSVYDSIIVTLQGKKSPCEQSDATGFICLNALRLKLRAALKGRGN